ncbi:MAG TPA: permease [Thermotogota bacterium]|mgnify:FL=1|nr:permease [Thermotogota bacterium]HRW35081.1 permease [Thermotogota bacterium]
MTDKREILKLMGLVGLFLIIFFLPFGNTTVQESIVAGFEMLGEYAREHVLLCLVPAFFVAGTIAVFVNRNAILKLLGPAAKKWIAYPVASGAGGILAVCSCTILPLFGGIYKRGAGLGPAIAFLFTGPAVNITAIFLTGQVLGWELSIVRLIATVVVAIVIGLIMSWIFREEKGHGGIVMEDDNGEKPLWVLSFLGLQMFFLVTGGLSINPVLKTTLLLLSAIAIIAIYFRFKKQRRRDWITETWSFAKKILPFLFVGVFIAGIISKALPEEVVQSVVGGNKFLSTLFASIMGALMYFSTLTEVPIVQSLMNLGMGKGPALSLFMTGLTLSLPNMIVLTKLLGPKKAFTYFFLVIALSSLTGFMYGKLM